MNLLDHQKERTSGHETNKFESPIRGVDQVARKLFSGLIGQLHVVHI
jgi:hypothetical protein